MVAASVCTGMPAHAPAPPVSSRGYPGVVINASSGLRKVNFRGVVDVAGGEMALKLGCSCVVDEMNLKHLDQPDSP